MKIFPESGVKPSHTLWEQSGWWFYITVGLSALNMSTVNSANVVMLGGLGSVLFLYAIAARLGVLGAFICGGMILLILGFFALCGWFARKGHAWAFIAGMAVYALDTMVTVLFQDWVMVAFHVFVLVMLGRGLASLLRGDTGETALAPPTTPPITDVPPAPLAPAPASAAAGLAQE